MKASIKIILIVSGVLVAFLVGSMMIIKQDLGTFLANKESLYNYKEIPVEEFHGVVFSGNWKVSIRNGVGSKLEIGGSDSVDWTLDNQDGILFIRKDTTLDKNKKLSYARITGSTLLSARMETYGEVFLNDLTQDSINLTFLDGGVLKGLGNTIGYTELKTSGEVLIQLTDDPMD